MGRFTTTMFAMATVTVSFAETPELAGTSMVKTGEALTRIRLGSPSADADAAMASTKPKQEVSNGTSPEELMTLYQAMRTKASNATKSSLAMRSLAQMSTSSRNTQYREAKIAGRAEVSHLVASDAHKLAKEKLMAASAAWEDSDAAYAQSVTANQTLVRDFENEQQERDQAQYAEEAFAKAEVNVEHAKMNFTRATTAADIASQAFQKAAIAMKEASDTKTAKAKESFEHINTVYDKELARNISQLQLSSATEQLNAFIVDLNKAMEEEWNLHHATRTTMLQCVKGKHGRIASETDRVAAKEEFDDIVKHANSMGVLAVRLETDAKAARAEAAEAAEAAKKAAEELDAMTLENTLSQGDLSAAE